jgi:hypothetical protein
MATNVRTKFLSVSGLYQVPPFSPTTNLHINSGGIELLGGTMDFCEGGAGGCNIFVSSSIVNLGSGTLKNCDGADLTISSDSLLSRTAE